MTVAIITQPLIENYGGLLQNWALQQVLRREFPGTDVVTFDQVDSLAPLYLRIGSAVKNYFYRQGRNNKLKPTCFQCFIHENINATRKARSIRDFRILDCKIRPDAYIVGSDQVWRPSMVFNLKANFLGFTRCRKKISYAASFGLDSWNFSNNDTKLARKLIRKFSAVSVRENSAVDLCKKYLNVEATQVLDPTLLLQSSDYELLISESNIKYAQEYVFTYILDSSPAKRELVKSIIGNTKEYAAAHDYSGVLPSNKLSVNEWLEGIRNARLVLCDSFHGVAFSIIFNKEFFVFSNNERGNTRIESLLKLFSLEDRLVNLTTLHSPKNAINWSSVNKKRFQLIADSLGFIKNSLCQTD